MAKPNFQFQKRQKELARKQKNEEKMQRKLERKAEDSAGETGEEATAVENEEKG